MTGFHTPVAANANAGGAETCTALSRHGAANSIIAECVRKLFPKKAWLEISVLFGLSERTAKHRLAGSREFTTDELARLLRSEHGYRVLVDLMADAQPKWWRLCVPLMEVAEVTRMQTAARRRLRRAVEGALDADADLTAAIARADMLSDSEFHRGHADALRAQARPQVRAVAGAAKGPLNSRR